MSKKILTVYRFARDEENANVVTSRMATYAEAVGAVKKVLRDRGDGETFTAPASAERLAFQDIREEGWHGTRIAWGDDIRIGKIIRYDRHLRIDGKAFKITEPE